MQSKLIRLAPRSLHRGLAALTLTAVTAASVPVWAQESTPAVRLDVARAAIALLPPRAPLATVAAETTPAPAPAAQPSADDGAGLRIAGYVAGGVGIAGLLLFAIAGLGAKNAYDDLDAACGSSPCTDDTQQSKIEEGRLLQTAANLGLAAGLSGIGIGATLLVLGNKSSFDKRDNSPSPSANGAMITYGGQF
ncbi:MAG: hypothetical protein ABW133_06555 [Polyangiaceae bacterium]